MARKSNKFVRGLKIAALIILVALVCAHFPGAVFGVANGLVWASQAIVGSMYAAVAVAALVVGVAIA